MFLPFPTPPPFLPTLSCLLKKSFPLLPTLSCWTKRSPC
jgi:hypothetical protein